MAALALFAIATIRIATRKTIAMGLVGLSGFTIAIATFLILLQNVYQIAFCKDIATALLIMDMVGTIAFARVLKAREA
jgi:energy-converting hydrogenase B subunit B